MLFGENRFYMAILMCNEVFVTICHLAGISRFQGEMRFKWKHVGTHFEYSQDSLQLRLQK